MAVRKITNKQVVSSADINRGKQTSTKDIKARGGNRSVTFSPGANLSKNYSITLKDVDTSVINHITNVIKPKVREANETADVSIMYGNEERWKAVRKRGVMRDKNVSIILPLIMLRRTSIDRATELPPNMEHDVKREYTQVVRNTKWSKTNRYDRFTVQTGLNPVTETLITGMPDFTDITYEFSLWTNYIEQMNSLVETFVHQSNTYWGDSTDYKFLCTTDMITDASEMTADGERLIKNEFSLSIKGYMIPEFTNTIFGTTSEMTKELTPSKIVFGFEGDATNKQVGLPIGNTPFGVLGRLGSPTAPEASKIRTKTIKSKKLNNQTNK